MTQPGIEPGLPDHWLTLLIRPMARCSDNKLGIIVFKIVRDKFGNTQTAFLSFQIILVNNLR